MRHPNFIKRFLKSVKNVKTLADFSNFKVESKYSKAADLIAINLKIKQCCKCDVSAPVVKTYGRGSVDAKYMFIGESPWIKNEWLSLTQFELDSLLRKKYGDKTCFGDLAGSILSQALSAAGFNEERDCYITNIVKCSLKNNAKPTKKEIQNCVPFLLSEIRIVKPKVIFAASAASRMFFGVKIGEKKKYENAEIIGIYHPSALQRSSGYVSSEFLKILEIGKKVANQ